jgi:uncharacterized protein (DUF983 family)
MKLVELNPRWIGIPNWSTDDPYYIGVRFSCPHCGRPIGAFFEQPIDPNRLTEKCRQKGQVNENIVAFSSVSCSSGVGTIHSGS